MKIRKRKFTIIELLVVIAIIGVLMGMLLPAVSAVRQNARKTKAKAEINGIISAIKQYEQTYGYFPVDSADNPTTLESSNAKDYRSLMERLTNYPGPGTSTAASTFIANARGMRFLDAPSNYGYNKGTIDTPTGATAWATERGDYADPWGSFYQIYVDTDYDGVVTLFSSGTDKDKNGAVFAYSLGPDKKHSTTSESATDNKDNICSWK